MNEEKKKNFYIGLDIGTESVGVAATDEQYHLLQKRGKPLMAVRLFDEAATAEERRKKRANKVRMNRRTFRLRLLQELLAEQVQKVDSLFFIRLEASSFWTDDKLQKNAGLTTADSLFADDNFTDKDFHKQYPSLYHLRKSLMEATQAFDVRLLYLACHHILKVRGHFLYSDENLGGSNQSGDMNMSAVGRDCFERLNNALNELAEGTDALTSLFFHIVDFAAINSIAQDDKLGYKERKEKLSEVLFPIAIKDKDNKKLADNILSVVLGKKAKLTELFPHDEIEIEMKEFTFDGKWEDETKGKLSSFLDDNQMGMIEILKEIYDWMVLMQLLKGEPSVSAAMVKRYQKHHEQLLALKNLVKEQAKEKYDKVFRAKEEKYNYPAYIGSNCVDGSKATIKKCSTEEFYNFLKKELAGVLTEEMLSDINNNQFLQKLRSKDNATIPHQLHKKELMLILANAKKFGMISDETAEKILSILSFRVPYYVGRMNPHYKNVKGHHVWIEKKIEGEKIRPWNYQTVIDLKASNVAFIERMLSKCTYLKDKAVLPKHSLLYAKFAVLNELNNLKIYSEPISVALKQDIFDKLFQNNQKASGKASVADLIKYLGGDIKKEDITGIDVAGNGFHSSYSVYVQASKIFGTDVDKAKNKEIVEDVILWHALHTDKKIVAESIQEKYPHLSQAVVQALKGLNFSGFGNLSREFLTTPRVIEKSTGLLKSVMDVLWETNYNLMELFKEDGEYNITDWLKEANQLEGEVNYDMVAQSYAAPSVKRSVWQAMKIVDELIELNDGKVPERIFVEVTRKNRQKDKKATQSRKSRLKTLWDACKTIDRQLWDELDKRDDKELRGEKLYLYFLQCGKCAYSGRAIKIDDLDKLYDVDHIIPQALKKDDSFTNKVLVERTLNGKKDMHYPFRHVLGITDAIIKMWENWYKSGLIPDEKLARLKRTAPLSVKELEGFIARQLVFAGQSSTVVADLLKLKYPNTQIIYSKAENVSDFRKKFDLLKCREANDHHHAHDAYLNIVVGNTYYQRFHKAYIGGYGCEDDSWTRYSQKHMFEYDVKGAWQSGKWKQGVQLLEGETEKTVKKVLSLKYLPVSKLTQENKGEFYKQNICAAKQHQKAPHIGADKIGTIPRKLGLGHPLSKIERYGGYTGMRPAYFMIVEYDVVVGSGKKRKVLRERAFDSVSLLDKKAWEVLSDEEKQSRLFDKYKSVNKKGELVCGNNIKIVIPKILINSLFEIDAMECRLSGRNENKVFFHNAKQVFYSNENIEYIRKIVKFNELVKKKTLKTEDYLGMDEIVVSGNRVGLKEYKLTRIDNQGLWNAILEKVNRLYGARMAHLKGNSLGLPDVYDKLITHNNQFADLDCIKQIGVLTAMIIGLGCNANAFDLSIFGGGATVGKIQPSVKIKYPLTLVNQSITGIKENRIVVYPFESEV